MSDIYTKNRSYHSMSNLCFTVIFNYFVYSLSLPGQRQQCSSTLHECIKEKPPAASLTNKGQESSYFICFLFYFKLKGCFVALLLPPQPSLSSFATSGILDNGCCEINGWKRFPFHFQQSIFFPFFLFFIWGLFDWWLKILLLSFGVQQPDSDAILVLSDLWQQNFWPQEDGVRDLV